MCLSVRLGVFVRKSNQIVDLHQLLVVSANGNEFERENPHRSDVAGTFCRRQKKRGMRLFDSMLNLLVKWSNFCMNMNITLHFLTARLKAMSLLGFHFTLPSFSVNVALWFCVYICVNDHNFTHTHMQTIGT